ncbi:rhodanese family protein [Erwinia sorbitola]|uniref:DUF2892 domain-containing protein n=1 Tax=Erwinia sorbitola TaxID=2681984 RepID=A0A6I6EQY1_9GAMM|nr:rhodanese family protein [Erwinia sorbitola]MTD28470.1 DUF2892 domain-containing protein [Erwinia sorbitola]QGU86583.1 DUF2892 domain-containing protein [Erwinia sorbitola]
MKYQVISPTEAKDLQARGATIVDIREPAEFLREHIADALTLPLSEIQKGKALPPVSLQHPVIFHCLSGARTQQHTDILIKAAHPHKVMLLEGGLSGWKQAKLPTIEDKKQPLPLMRQVQITAGSLVVIGVLLGYTLGTGFFLLSGFIGAGLVFAGLSGWCGMANVLAKMPWNKIK